MKKLFVYLWAPLHRALGCPGPGVPLGAAAAKPFLFGLLATLIVTTAPIWSFPGTIKNFGQNAQASIVPNQSSPTKMASFREFHHSRRHPAQTLQKALKESSLNEYAQVPREHLSFELAGLFCPTSRSNGAAGDGKDVFQSKPDAVTYKSCLTSHCCDDNNCNLMEETVIGADSSPPTANIDQHQPVRRFQCPTLTTEKIFPLFSQNWKKLQPFYQRKKIVLREATYLPIMARFSAHQNSEQSKWIDRSGALPSLPQCYQG